MSYLCVNYMFQSIIVFLIYLTIYFMLKKEIRIRTVSSKQGKSLSAYLLIQLSKFCIDKLSLTLNTGIIYSLQLVMFSLMKNQHLILYWNLYHAPLKRVFFFIVAVIFAIQWCTQKFFSSNFVEIFQMKRIPTIIILMIIMRMKHIDWIFVSNHPFIMYASFLQNQNFVPSDRG